MVRGIESSRTKFMDYADCYTVIGGAACDILMSEEDLSFRATKDIEHDPASGRPLSGVC